jgi:hypothetical protein
MGCFQSSEAIDFDTIQPAVLRTRGGSATYSGSTERGRCQVHLISCYLKIIYIFLLDVR